MKRIKKFYNDHEDTINLSFMGFGLLSSAGSIYLATKGVKAVGFQQASAQMDGAEKIFTVVLTNGNEMCYKVSEIIKASETL